MSATEGAEEALRAALAAEHAAIYGYGIVGAHLSGLRQNRAHEAGNAHRAARERLRAMIRATGTSPPPAASDYALPNRVTEAESAVHLAVRLEERVAEAYAQLVGAGKSDTRGFAAREMRDCALRAAAWRGSTVAFPGLPRSATRRR